MDQSVPNNLLTVTKKQFKAVLTALDRKRYKVDKSETELGTSWYAVRMRRIGLYRTSIVDGDSILVGSKTGNTYSLTSDLSALELDAQKIITAA